MRTRRRSSFTTIRTEGAILPVDLLEKIAVNSKDLDGLDPPSYHLPPKSKLNEAISQSWNRVLGMWESFKTAREKISETDQGTSVTRERWLLPLFQELGYGRLQGAKAIELEGKSYPLSHLWQQMPFHLVGFRTDLDKRTAGVAGAARVTPHGLIQELLNRSDDYLWGIVSNGDTLRILRDNKSLTRQAYVQFDLNSMLDGEVYSDFTLLWLLLHQSRVEAEKPEQFWLEKWSRAAHEQGRQALDQLRYGVEKAIEALGKGFLLHPANRTLVDDLKSGALDVQDYYRQLLRIVYRLLFLFIAEDRELLFDPKSDAKSRKLYTDYYSTRYLRRLADTKRGTRHPDLFETFRLVTSKLGELQGCPELALPPLGGFLFSKDASPNLKGCNIANRNFLEAVHSLAFMVDGKTRRSVDYKNIGVEELGSVYESLLELHPTLHTETGTFSLGSVAGHERKTTGSYYTPDSLVQCLLDSALDPVLDEAAGKKDPEQAILNLKACDPAAGSGHFLIAAAHRIAKRLATVRTGDEEPSPQATRTALRDVIGRCVYGVDVNPMAVELCKFSLWVEAIEPGKPLSFLDAHIRCGNSLLGATPELLKMGIPDDAFKPIEGDDKKYCSQFKKENKRELSALYSLFDREAEPWQHLGNLPTAIATVDCVADDTLENVHEKEDRFAKVLESADYVNARFLHDAWCAAFVWKKCSRAHGGFDYPITNEILQRIERNPHDCQPWMRGEIERLTEQYQFFHWHLQFPTILGSSGRGGFDCVLGNPPWERVKLLEKEWFAERSPEIAGAPSAAARKRLIDGLKTNDVHLHQRFLEDSRSAEGQSHLLRHCGRFPLCGRGDINLYAVFAEGMRTLLNKGGRTGCVLPTGIATDDTTKLFFQEIVKTRSLVSLFSFENEEFVFPEIHHATRFCLFTCGQKSVLESGNMKFVFFARQVEHLRESERLFTLSAVDIALLNPNTHTCPTFRSRQDAELAKAIHRRTPILIRDADGSRPEENPWNIKFSRMLDMSNDSHLFLTKDQLEADGWRLVGNVFAKDNDEFVPLYEAKMIHHFDHRWGTYDGQTEAQAKQGKLPELDDESHADPDLYALSRYWIDVQEVDKRLSDKRDRRWLLGFRDITGATVLRTVIGAVIPRVGAGNSLPLFIHSRVDPPLVPCFIGSLSSYCCDFAARFKVGGTHLNFFICQQLPVPKPSAYDQKYPWLGGSQTLKAWLVPILLELVYTAWDLKPFAEDCGWNGPPFRWDSTRRHVLQSMLDAAFFHLYLPADKSGDWQSVDGEVDEDRARLRAIFAKPRDAVNYIMESFPIVKRNEEKAFGEFRTKRVILDTYDAMTDSMRAGVSYRSDLNPTPGPPMNVDGSFAKLPDWPHGAPRPNDWPTHIHEPRRNGA